MEQEHESYFQCPYCWSQISMLVETSVGMQCYIEDCEVCCHPIEISYGVVDNEVSNFFAKRLDD